MKEHKIIKQRVKKLLEKIKRDDIDGALITCDENVFYFSGFKGDSTILLLTKEKSYLFTDFRYIEQAEAQAESLEIIKTGRGERFTSIEEKLNNHNVKTLGLENDHLVLSDFELYKNAFSLTEFKNISDEISLLRTIKSKSELDFMQKAATINDESFLELIKKIKVGMSEMDVYAELTYIFNKRGCAHAFTPIIASGENSALPHAPLTLRKIQYGDFLTVDFGAKLGAYCSDCTRTIGIGGLDSDKEKVYHVVKNAQEMAIKAAKPGMKTCDLDAVARDYISKNGYEDYFGHGLGHGVGLFIHEHPTLNPRFDTLLKEGMVFTIEPGVYIKGKYGVRIEDTVTVTKDGILNFNSLYKDLIII